MVFESSFLMQNHSFSVLSRFVSFIYVSGNKNCDINFYDRFSSRRETEDEIVKQQSNRKMKKGGEMRTSWDSNKSERKKSDMKVS